MIKLPKIFLDSCSVVETKRVKSLIGKVDGQTTNPSLLAKNPEIQAHLAKGKKLTEAELIKLYKEEIEAIAKEVAGSISIEVYGDWETKTETMVAQALEMVTWCHQATIKFPTIPNGLAAAQEFIRETKGERKVNMTLVFDQVQAAAVYAATLEAKTPAFISPFAGRWDDRGFNGLDLVKNILKQYRVYDKNKIPHVEVLAASMRTLDHLYSSIMLGVAAVTIPLKLIEAWVEDEKFIPDTTYRSPTAHLNNLIYQDIPFKKELGAYNVANVEGSLLTEGIGKFASDWQQLLVEEKPPATKESKPKAAPKAKAKK